MNPRRQWRKGAAPQLLGLLLTVTAVLTATPPAHADVDAAAVQRAIDRGVSYLRKTQGARGGWNEFRNESCGVSALCTLAMLNAGVPRDDPDMVAALRYLRDVRPERTYSLALQTLAFCQAGAAGDLPRIRANVEALVENQRTESAGSRSGSWTYQGRGSGSGDPSNTQFALLALGAAVDRGVQVDPKVFQRSVDYWRLRQLGSGGWSYLGQRATGSMTSAGIASLIIAGGRVENAAERLQGESVECCVGASDDRNSVARGLDYLGKVVSVKANPGLSINYYFYYMYALERVGRLTGQRFIGGRDWYREGADRLVTLQDNFQGFWAGSNTAESDPNIATALALLFLSKGKRQVVIGRLNYATGAEDQRWQRHPQALRPLVRHLERDWRRDLTWQTVTGERADVGDLLQTPVLVISGRERLDFEPGLVQLLNEYIQQGGCILFDADAGSGCGDARGFEQSVQELCAEWFDDAPLERLPPTHPVWFAEHRVDPVEMGQNYWMYGVQACCRTAVFYSPSSLSCRWELGDELFRRVPRETGARQEVKAAIRLGQNVVAYATGRELKDKLDQRLVIDGSTVDRGERGVIQMARLQLGAGGNDARRALPNAAAIVRSRVPIPLVALEQPVAFDEESLNNVPILWIHGRTEFELTNPERKQLAEFVQRGGFIIGSAICGNEAFTEAFRREIAAALPEAGLRPLPPEHPAFSDAFGGFDVRTVAVRTTAGSTDSLTVVNRQRPPLIEAAAIDGVTKIFFSPLDISCALESQNSVQCPGYTTEDAAKIVANLLLYALQQ